MSFAVLAPPSAIIALPRRAPSSAASRTAESCGTPIPATTRVVQIEPGPIPILTTSAPASYKAAAPEVVAILPAIMFKVGNASRTSETLRNTPSE